MSTLLIITHTVIFSAIFFSMFCRLNSSDEKTNYQIRWALVALLASCLVEILAPIVWKNYTVFADYFFATSVLFLQLSMAKNWNLKK